MSTIVSITDTTCILNGHLIRGWSDDADALMLPDIEVANIIRGADGLMVASSTGDRGGEVTIKLLANSPSAAFLFGQAGLILRGARIIFNGSIRNARMGMSTRLDRGVMKTLPGGQTMGKGEAAAREFVFEFQEVLPNYDGAVFPGVPSISEVIAG